MADIAQQLLDIRDEIEKNKEDKAKTEGRLEELMSGLKEEWQCDTIEEAEEVLVKFNNHIDKLSTEMDGIADKLEERGWDI